MRDKRFGSTILYCNIPVIDQELFDETARLSIELCLTMKDMDYAAAGISNYTQKYVCDNYTKIDGWGTNSLSLAHLIAECGLAKESITLLDYGAGSGSISMLAKALGIGKVLYSDVYDLSCRDASRIADTLGLKADHYIHGDINSVVSYMHEHGLTCNVMVSHNCLEHIYDIAHFFQSLQNIPGRRLDFWLSTGANPHRPKTRRALARVAQRAEGEDREKVWGHKERDALRSYLSIRREIIQNRFPQIEQNDIEILAKKTRGLREDDIGKVVAHYIETGKMPPDLDHPTNTCDPYTGNWAERLMDPFKLGEALIKMGFEVNVKPLYWTIGREHRLKNMMKAITNIVMSSCPPSVSLKLSPGYVLCGHR